MKKLWTVLITLVILSLTLGTIACGGGATEPTGGDTSSSGSGGGGTSGGDSSGETCCWRDGGTVAPVMPPGQINDLGGIIVDAIDSPHMDSSYTRCPLKIDFINLEWKPILDERIRAMCAAAGAEPDPEAQAIQAQLLDIDYLFKGQIIVDEQTGYVDEKCEKDDQGQQSCSGGDILGSFTFKLQLVDHHRDVEVVVKQGQVSWSGSIFNGLNAIKELSRTFKPLPEIIHKYEGLPEKATLEPEKDPAPAGEKMTIHLKDIVDYKGDTSQPWQWVIVKAEKGQIELGNNGRDAGEGAVAFEVGGGALDFIYKAPDKCDKDTENKDTITVYNTCNNDPRTAGSFPRKNVIATKSFDIDCTGWLLEFTYTATCPNGYGLTPESEPPKWVWEKWETRTYIAKVRAVLKPRPLEQGFSMCYLPGCQNYACDSATVELQDNGSNRYHEHQDLSSYAYEETVTGSWTMQYKGDLPLYISLALTPDANSSAKNGVPSYSFNLTMWGDSQQGEESAVPVLYQWTGRSMGDHTCSGSGTLSVSFIPFFMPSTIFSLLVIEGLNTLVGEGGIPQEYTYSDENAFLLANWLMSGIDPEMCAPRAQGFQGFNATPYTNVLKWTLTKLGE